MFYCINCKQEISQLKRVYETHGLNTPPYEERVCCPYCNSENFVELNRSVSEMIDIIDDYFFENFSDEELNVLGIESKEVAIFNAQKDAKYWHEKYNYLVYKLKNLIGG